MKAKILVVEDDKSVSNLISTTLTIMTTSMT